MSGNQSCTTWREHALYRPLLYSKLFLVFPSSNAVADAHVECFILGGKSAFVQVALFSLLRCHVLGIPSRFWWARRH